MSDAYTFYFQDVVPDYDTWKAIMSAYGVIDYETADAGILAFDSWAFNVLNRHFHNQNIRYAEPDAFWAQLSIVYENRMKLFKRERELLDETYKLSEDEIAKVSTALQNSANNPNTAPSDPTQPLNYISYQDWGFTMSNRLQAYLYAINNLPSMKIMDFIRGKMSADDMSFQDLFMQVIPRKYNIFKE